MRLASTSLKLPPLPPDVPESSYQKWLSEQHLPVTLQVLSFAAFAIVGFGAWDAFVSASAIFQTWPIRLIALGFVGACLTLLRFPGVAAHWRGISFVSSCTLFCLLLIILVHLPQGPLLGAGGLLMPAFLFRVHSPRLALVASVFNVLAVLVVYRVFNVEPRLIINTQIFLLIASVGNVMLNASDDASERHKFALEWHLQRAATTDGLTGAANRRFFSDKLDEEIERAHRYNHTLTLILLDIDRFKRVNDTRGHGDGDLALKAVAAIGIESGRASDTFARLGGEEFVMLLPHADLSSALAIAERLRNAIESQPIVGDSGTFRVTASFGVAALRRNENGDTLVARADAALYLAKNSGRNRVVSQSQLQHHSAPQVV